MGQSSQTHLKVMQKYHNLRIGLGGKVMQDIKILRIRINIQNFELNVSVKQNETWKIVTIQSLHFLVLRLQAFGDMD
jgi:hypothetical protein